MRIEECFDLFTTAVTKYNSYYKDISYSVRESGQKDYLLCDIARVIGTRTHKSVKNIAVIIASYLPFETEVLTNGDIKFNLWQEVQL